MIFKKLFAKKKDSGIDDLVRVLALIESESDAVTVAPGDPVGARRGDDRVVPAAETSDRLYDFASELRGDPVPVGGPARERRLAG